MYFIYVAKLELDHLRKAQISWLESDISGKCKSI